MLDIFKGGAIFGEMSAMHPRERDESAEVVVGLKREENESKWKTGWNHR